MIRSNCTKAPAQFFIVQLEGPRTEVHTGSPTRDGSAISLLLLFAVVAELAEDLTEAGCSRQQGSLCLWWMFFQPLSGASSQNLHLQV